MADRRTDLAPALARALWVLAAVLAVLALAANPWVIGRFLVPDGTITHRGPIYTMQLAIVAVASVVALGAKHLRTRREPLRPRDLVAGLALASVTFLFCAGVSEIVVRGTRHPLEVLTPNTDAWWEMRWRIEHGIRDSLLTRPKYGHDRYDPDLGWSPRPGFADDRAVVNAQGIRAIRTYAPEPPPRMRRIVVAGDSYTWGENVTNAETYVAVMESLRADVEAINLGVHGYGTDQQLLRLRRDGFPLSPHVVVLAVFGQNMNRNVLTFRDYAKPRFRLERETLRLENVPVPPPPAVMARPEPLPRSWLLALAERSFTHALGRTRLADLAGSEKWRVTRALLEAVWQESEAAGARFLLVYVPWRVQEERLPLELPIAAWANASGVPFLNLREAFVELPRAEWDALYGGHWTPHGHRRAAEAIVARLDVP